MLTIPEIIKKYGILANKKLGQNFLMNEEICKKIALAGDVSKDDLVVEIGGGLGSLTRFLIGNSRLLVIEKDANFIPILKNEYTQNLEVLEVEYKNIEEICVLPLPLGEGRGEGIYPHKKLTSIQNYFEIIEGDALKFDFSKLEEFKVIANLPYNIGSLLLTNWITLENRPETMVLMLQKEVVERIIAKPKTKDYGRLSILSQSFYNCEKLFDVSRNSFNPVPNVTSSVIKMKRKNCNINPIKLAKLTEHLFSSRRKILKGAFKSLGIEKPEFENKRAEELTIDEILSLIKT